MTAMVSPLIQVHKRSLDELMRDLDARGRVLVYGALVRVFTLGQIARLVSNADVERAEGLLDELHYTDRWIDRLDEVRLPRYCAGGGIVSVYYLTSQGAAALKSIALEIHKHARPGQPKGKLRERIPHELLVAEAFIWLNERYSIKNFLPETELKSQIGKARVQEAGRRLESLPDESTGDFKVCLDQGGREQTIECEIAVHYEYHQIAAKPDKMLWFTRDGRQADLIETVKGARPVMLGDVAAPQTSNLVEASAAFRPTGKNKQRNRRTFKQRVLAGLDRLGGCSTADALSSVMRVHRSLICRVLNQLNDQGEIGKDSAHLRPGEDQGRPLTVYFRPEAAPTSIHTKVRHLIIARAIILMSAKTVRARERAQESEYRLHDYDRDKLQIEFRHRSDQAQPALIFVVDDQLQPPDNTFTRLRAAEARASARSAIVAALVASPTRLARLRVLCRERAPQSKVIDIWQLGREKPAGDKGRQNEAE